MLVSYTHLDVYKRQVQGIEGVEKLLLRSVLAGDKLDVVHKQHVRLPVFQVEVLRSAGLDGGNQLVGEFLPLDVDDVGGGVVFVDFIADGIQQVGFSKAAARCV